MHRNKLGGQQYVANTITKNTAVRNLIRETQSMNDVVYPLFIVDGQGVRKEIGSMKDQYHLSLDMLGAETSGAKRTGYSLCYFVWRS